MDKNDTCYQAYLQILERELVPAMGCTEPIAIAYAAALAKKTLEEDIVKEVNVYASGNVIKNVKMHNDDCFFIIYDRKMLKE